MVNIDSARRLIDDLRRAGVDEFCVCAGSRNAPLLAVLGATDAPVLSFFDERSAAFFALGRAKRRARPVAVITTSGTAVAEMFPAAIEAYYSGVPLVLVSADRPSRYRGTGAPQAIEQENLFGVYAETALDAWSGRGPLHLNVEFDEPLIDGPVTAPPPPAAVAWPRAARRQTRALDGEGMRVFDSARPLVILGSLEPAQRDRAKRFAMRFGAPVWAEAPSGLREDPDLPVITAGERMIAGGAFDGVIRIGGVPALRFWRDLEELDLPVVHFSDLPFPGLTRGALFPVGELPADPAAHARDEAFFARDRAVAEALANILDEEPESELAMIRAVSRGLTRGSRVYLGNSLPIREWDLVASREDRGIECRASRGANGIDGQLSTFFGQCDPARDNVCVVGDLTALYDLAAPWIVPQMEAARFRIVVVNNGGGRIFGRVASLRALDAGFRERVIENAHALRFDRWSAMWGIEDRVTELLPDAAVSARAWQRYDELWR